ncbi:alcohol dehydrogenase 2 [Aspergillus ochraceoroseus]|uniref:alcohol dehydrogenase n=1 Tax=Aspergillus ochraceoroseus TaxID=138278 RepID=A0A0F8UJG3_9EURO|nr:alcohol dehydrogenase 2 [Aspergillus ochraceoroseus]
MGCIKAPKGLPSVLLTDLTYLCAKRSPRNTLISHYKLPISSLSTFSSRFTPNTAASYVKTATMSIPDMQWAQVVEEKGSSPVYKQIPVPKPGPDEILVNVRYSGVCHTDLHAMKGDWPLALKLPLVGGHEGAGVVVAKGDLVEEFEIGDHAGLKWLNGSCLACEYCMQSEEPLCPHAALSGYTVDGTFQQYAIGKAALASKIPKNVPLDAAAPILCAGITVYKGLKESGVRPGQTVAIVGAGGGLGSLAQQYAKAMGLRIIAIDSGDEKKVMCEELGAEQIQRCCRGGQSRNTGRLGAHAVILLAVAEKPFQQATEYVRSRGSVVAIGLPAGAFLKAPVFNTVVRMINIKGSYVGNRQDGVEALDFFARGLIKAPFKTAPLKDLPEIFKMMEQGQIAGRYVLEIPQ